jgi:hypothetical protein
LVFWYFKEGGEKKQPTTNWARCAEDCENRGGENDVQNVYDGNVWLFSV